MGFDLQSFCGLQLFRASSLGRPHHLLIEDGLLLRLLCHWLILIDQLLAVGDGARVYQHGDLAVNVASCLRVGNAELQKCRNAEMQKCGAAEMWKGGRVEMWRCGNAEIPNFRASPCPHFRISTLLPVSPSPCPHFPVSTFQHFYISAGVKAGVQMAPDPI